MSEFVPEPIITIDTPEGLKAFTDPLRLQVLRILSRREATNQQIADELNEPHAKVLYHIRFLLDIGLIKLVDTQIKGGNVEKYYRAIARVFELRGTETLNQEDSVALATNILEPMRHDFIASVLEYPDFEHYIENHAGWSTAAQMREFKKRVEALFEEYFSQQPPAAPTSTEISDTETVHRMRLSFLLYRDVTDRPGKSQDGSSSKDK